jgi:hypothetical protein
MLDYQTISYGDICLSERDGVAKTYGKGIMQTTYPLSIFSGDAVKLTTAQLFWPITQKSIHGVGVLPTDGTKTVRENYQEDERNLLYVVLTRALHKLDVYYTKELTTLISGESNEK